LGGGTQSSARLQLAAPHFQTFSIVMSTFRFFVSEAFRFFAFDQKINEISFFLLSTNAAPALKTFIYAFDHAQMQIKQTFLFRYRNEIYNFGGQSFVSLSKLK
jgi:hypothetical protein